MSRDAVTPPAPHPPDQAAREHATRCFATNLVVTAGAGTGKTAILVERTLNLIGRGEATLGRLALITFTDKAAAELRLRLGSGLDRLRRRAAGDGSPIDVREDGDRAWTWLAASGVGAEAIGRRALAALQELDAASVGTIHQFCLDLLRRHPREARVDPRAAVGEAAAIDRVADEAWDRFLRGPDGPGDRAEAWRAALARCGSTAPVRALGEALARFTLPTAARDPYRPPALQDLLAPALEATRARLDDLAARARKMPPRMTTFVALAREHLATIAREGLPPAAARRLAAELAPFVKSFPDPGKRLEGATAEEIEEAAAEALDLLRALAEVDEEAVAALHETARPLAGAAQRLTLERGFVPFDAMLRLARETLARYPEVRRETRARYRMLLVDEFQDTDPLQYEVVFLIAGRDPGAAAAPGAASAAGETAEIDAWTLDLEPGRLFIVGDPKQSIYRFRRADIAAFRRAVDRVRACGGEELRLSASFRSPARLLTPINRIFDDWLGPRGDWRDDERPPYVPIEPAAGPEAAGPPRVMIWSADAGAGADALAGRRAEAAAIAAEIATRLGTRTGAEGEVWRPSHFALLFRATGNVGLYARALTAAGLPCLVEGGRDFAERPEVGDLLSFLRAVANPNDGPAFLAVLRGPLGAVPDAELLEFAGEGSLEAVAGGGDPPDPARFPNLRRSVDLLCRFRARHRGRPPDDLIQAALDETPLALLHAASHDGSERLAHLRRLAARARAEAAAGFTLAEILAAIETVFESAQGPGDGPIADETLDAVRLLSVHKAKGLEFEVVFVPDVGRQEGGGGAPRGDRTAVDWLDAAGGAELPAIRLADGRANAARVLFDRAQARHEIAEERRVFYVACTRARRELILVNSRTDRRAPWRDRLEALGYRVDRKAGFPPAGLLAEGLVEHRRVQPVTIAPTPIAPFDAGRFSAAAAAHRVRAGEVTRAARPPIAWPSGTRAEERLDESPARTPAAARPVGRDAGVDARLVARLAGIAVHRALEAWNFRDEQALRARAAAATRSAVAREGGGPVEAQGVLAAVDREVAAILDGLLGSPLPGRLASATILGREVPILHRAPGGATWGGACDLVYRDARGLVVADYKTDRVEGADAAATHARLAATYADQLAVYRDAVAATHPGETVRGELLMLRTGTVIDLPARKS